MKQKTKSIGINFSGYPVSSSNFIVDNGLLLMIDALLKSGHDTKAIDYNVPSIIDVLRIPPDLQRSIDSVVEKLETNTDPSIIQELTSLDYEVEKTRTEKMKSEARRLAKYCSSQDIDFIWMKLWTGDGFKYSSLIADEIKNQNPSIKIVGGGPHVRLFREKAFSFAKSFDILNYGEGEIILPMVADWLLGKRDIEKIPSTLYLKDGSVFDTKGCGLADPNTLNENLIPENFFEYYKDRYEGLEEKIMIGFTETSRGCPENHIFCQHSANSGDRWRLIDEETILTNFRRYHKNGIKVNRIPDSNPPKEHLIKIYQMMKKEGLTFDMISAFCEIPEFSGELARTFKEVGGFSLFFGIESGSEKIRRTLGKEYSSEEIQYKIQLAKNLGIKIATSFMVPSVGETRETLQESKKLISSLAPDYLLIGPTIPMGQILETPKKFGYELGSDFYDSFQFFSPKLHLPPYLRDTLPIKLNGLTWQEQMQISQKLTEKLSPEILPYISDELAMIAYMAGKHPKEFTKDFNKALVSGNSEKITSYISDINNR